MFYLLSLILNATIDVPIYNFYMNIIYSERDDFKGQFNHFGNLIKQKWKELYAKYTFLNTRIDQSYIFNLTYFKEINQFFDFYNIYVGYFTNYNKIIRNLDKNKLFKKDMKVFSYKYFGYFLDFEEGINWAIEFLEDFIYADINIERHSI